METVSGSDVLEEVMQEEETVAAPDEEMHTSESFQTVSGNDTVEDGFAALPSGEDTEITLPDAIALNNEQFEILIAKQEEIHQSIHVQTFMICLLLGVLIGIVFVRGFGRFVKGV